MSEFLSSWLMLVAAFSVALISPGPDFLLAIRTTLTSGVRAGLWTALGFGLGILVHVTYTILGFATLIMHSQFWFAVIKYAGAAYLLWLAYGALRSQGANVAAFEAQVTNAVPQNNNHRAWVALRQGFVTNVLNPKATLFFVALFSQVIKPTMPVWVQVGFGLTCAIMCGVWFCVVAFAMGHAKVRMAYLRASKTIDRVCGGFFVALAARLALSEK
jgi:RhtB (resistance to homoserine/threonine) family protein